MDICGKPLLQWWIELLEKHGVTEVLINLHHFPEKVISFIESNKTPIKFTFFQEDKLLGSGGTLRENKDFVKDEESFFILYADNLTNYNLTDFKNFHITNGKQFSMALFRSPRPENCGIALLDENKTIVEFEEKPVMPKSDLANAGLYICTPEILEEIPYLETTDIGFHLLPKLVGKMAGWETDDYLIDIGTFENLNKAEEEWKTIITEN